MSASVRVSEERSAMVLQVGRYLVIYSVAAVLVWVGSLKFFAYEAMAIQPLVDNSPILSWVYDIFDPRPFARILGTVEILAGVAIALRPWLPRLAALGALFAIVLFVFTVTFLFSTPGVWQDGNAGQLSPMPGQFLAKDVVLLAASVWVLGDALRALRRTPAATPAPERVAA